MKVNGVVCYPVYINGLEIPDGSDEGDIHEHLMNRADELFESSTIKPVVHEYSFYNENQMQLNFYDENHED